MPEQDHQRAALDPAIRWLFFVGPVGGVVAWVINDLAGPRLAAGFVAVLLAAFVYPLMRREEMPPALALLAAGVLGTLVGGFMWLINH